MTATDSAIAEMLLFGLLVFLAIISAFWEELQ